MAHGSLYARVYRWDNLLLAHRKASLSERGQGQEQRLSRERGCSHCG
jgi:hypothetical protein